MKLSVTEEDTDMTAITWSRLEIKNGRKVSDLSSLVSNDVKGNLAPPRFHIMSIAVKVGKCDDSKSIEMRMMLAFTIPEMCEFLKRENPSVGLLYGSSFVSSGRTDIRLRVWQNFRNGRKCILLVLHNYEQMFGFAFCIDNPTRMNWPPTYKDAVSVAVKCTPIWEYSRWSWSGRLWAEKNLWRMPSFGMLRRVVLVRTDVSEKLSASIIRMRRIGALRTMFLLLFLVHRFLPPWWWKP
jgi:hypothetical protein